MKQEFTIYAIYSKHDYAILYVGYTMDFAIRERCHRSDLISGRHCNKGLLKHIQYFGIGDLLFVEIQTIKAYRWDARQVEKTMIAALAPTCNMAKAHIKGWMKENEAKYLNDAISKLQQGA